jgi:small subunit ribosomal protein S21
MRFSSVRQPGAPLPSAPFSPCDTAHAKSGKKLQVLVRDNNVEQAMRVLKKKMQREGVFREMKARRAYEKPSEKRVREKAEAVRRTRKAARKQAQREGLLPAPKKKALPARPSAAKF